MMSRSPSGEALISALPQPAALLDLAGRVLLANAAMRTALGGAVLMRPGDLATRLFPSAQAEIQAALSGQSPAPVNVESVGLLRLVPLAPKQVN